MSSRNRYRSTGQAMSWGNLNGMHSGDSVGNRRSFKEIRVPADDIGNRNDFGKHLDSVRDDIGNSIDLAPTHSLNSSMVGADGKTRRRKEDMASSVRVGRYIMGGVNPVVAGGNPIVSKGSIDSEGPGTFYPVVNESSGDDEQVLHNKKRHKKSKNEFRGNDAGFLGESAERRLRRLFDFDEDDRFEYVLSSDPEQKRLAAEETVKSILEKSGRLAEVTSMLLKNANRQSVLVIMDENRLDNADKPLFVRGSVELTALNFIVNKIVNRYPNDRIRLAVLPKIDEEEYLKSFHAFEVSVLAEGIPPVVGIVT
jgi:hypothetical protein